MGCHIHVIQEIHTPYLIQPENLNRVSSGGHLYFLTRTNSLICLDPPHTEIPEQFSFCANYKVNNFYALEIKCCSGLQRGILSKRFTHNTCIHGWGGVEKNPHNKLKKYTFCIFLWSYFRCMITRCMQTYMHSSTHTLFCLLHLLQNLHMTTVRSDRLPSHPISI